MEFKKRGYRLASGVLLFFIVLACSVKRKMTTVIIGVLVSSFTLWFHRNPDRDLKRSASHVSPVDGKIQDIEDEKNKIRISIYLGLTDVHTIKAMSKTRIENIERGGCGNYPALLKDISEKNNSLNYTFENGDEVSVFTGFLARRLMNESEIGELVSAGDEIGFISFGSRCVITIDQSNLDDICVSEGDYVKSESSVIGVEK